MVKPCAINWELMYCILEVDAMESEDAFENGEPNSDMETSSAQWASFFGVVAIVNDEEDGLFAEQRDLITGN